MFRHPKLPLFINIDPDAIDMLLKAEPGNAFVGVMNIHSGDVYLNPVLRRDIPGYTQHLWTGSDFNGIAKVKGIPVQAIEHNALLKPFVNVAAKRVQAHIQFVERLRNDILKQWTYKEDWVGFGIRSRSADGFIPPDPRDGPNTLYLTARSYSLNANKFRYWASGNQDSAFEMYHQRMGLSSNNEYSRLMNEMRLKGGMTRDEAHEDVISIMGENDITCVHSAPRWKDVIVRKPRGVVFRGEYLPENFKDALLEAFKRQLFGRIHIREEN